MEAADSAAQLPVACTLGQADGAQRMRRWQALVGAMPPQRTRQDGRLELRWSLDAAGLDELAALVAAERECCGFVAWALAREDGGAVLTISARPGRPGDVDALAGLFG